MKPLRLTLLLVAALASGCVWQPIAYDASARASVETALAEFRKEEALSPFFEQAVAYAVFPGSFRAGTGFGGAYGGGRRRFRRAAVPQHPVFQDRAGAAQFQEGHF